MTKLADRRVVAVEQTDPDSDEKRDYTVETDWFPIFREGDYPQGPYTKKDIDEIVEEFKDSLRRSPIVFDHLNDEDMAPGAKPGPAAGFVIDLRATNDETPQYKGKRLLECRAKVSHWASWQTRDGSYRSVSVGLYAHTSHKDKKERKALHHLALLGAQTPGIEGLPEVIFSASNAKPGLQNVSFSLESGFAIQSAAKPNAPSTKEKSVDPITFSEHTAKLDAALAEAKLTHNGEVQTFKSQISTLEQKIAKFNEELTDAKEDLSAAKTELETVKAEIPVKEEAARQDGFAKGEQEGTLKADRLFKEKQEQDEIKLFCDGLLTSGRINRAEHSPEGKPTLAETILAVPAGNARDSFRQLLANRPAIAGKGNAGAQSLFREKAPESREQISDESLEAEQTRRAQVLVAEKKFTNFRAAFDHVRKGGE